MLSTPTNSVLILLHPDILKFIDGGETNSAVYIITGQISSLSVKLDRLKMTKQTEVEWKIWGLSRISALKFLNSPGTSTHGNLRLTPIFITQSGEWKLSGLKVLSSSKDPQPILYALGGLFPEAARYTSPELMKTGYKVLKESVVVEKIWPNVLTGFTDTVPIIREAKVKSALLLAPKVT
ncbi:hypothetical protein H4Q26_005185 [Puccinia striiformis f. sp. tritici PST-130]|nr:hypothetical protein H4Q26_005185 [Puccinia striiformis f. sp. tritici PST-130]